MTDIVERVGGPHEWGYRDVTDGTFIPDNAPFEAADEIERLRHAWAVACKNLGETRADNKQLRSIIGDLLWAIGHDDEQILNETTARAKAVLENKPSVVEAPEMCWHTENKP